jgi:polyisoprenoid-binding protein YceI
MRNMAFILALALGMVAPPVVSAATWKIDTSHSNVGFKVRHFFSKVPGTFTQWEGTVVFDRENPVATEVQVTIDASSIDTGNEKRDTHLRGEDFFWTEEHPELTFQSSRVEETADGYRLHGLLGMRGVENPVVLNAKFLGAGPDGWGGTRAGFVATTTVNRKDWGINWNKALDQGGTVLSDDVEITIDLEAVLVEEVGE